MKPERLAKLLSVAIILFLTTSKVQSCEFEAKNNLCIHQQTISLPLKQPVGTFVVHLEDHSRTGHRTLDLGPRQLGVRFFYPAVINNKETKLAALPDKFARVNQLIFDEATEPSAVEKLRSLNWNIAEGAKIDTSSGALPLIILSHGYYLNPELFVISASYIASRGYLVASINHTFGSSHYTPPNSKTKLTIELPRDDLGSDLAIWSADQLFVLEHLQQKNQKSGSVFYNKISDKVGIIGHSYGGAAAFHSAAQSDKVDAIINLDGTVFNSKGLTIKQPFMYVHADEEYFSEIFVNVKNKGYVAIFEDLNHVSFTDFVVFKEMIQQPQSTQQIDNNFKAIMDVANLSTGFFEHHLDNNKGDFKPPANLSRDDFSFKVFDCNSEESSPQPFMLCTYYELKDWLQQTF
ncbi:alpha/beta hydrolase family protein [Pseudoalteromonas luteoviolacea]|uniref:Uncharacterized protein n=1 Tax=Pseudoalteromonas luteoviolacea H33 TaxID=1365251 RepID=A0A167AY17_9GAMM|nr:alpha/beta hydrolase [Pseudoalteromonas luteoviolacea]KZN45936.1 hypothetical protein N476_24665 [Pseudoalteromonas luteoviolacea H33]KZN71225.1 hypothetical protein N477_25685 [Pseudoalteromonas luteoviolacea H33-S]MBQ4880375.1 alpha/beta hydrolase [Pseudoalteromonas luteoviolacea]MBQ4909444.1 alpha/beta hydrolase [Pseudoalteromonas luteoviolacea]